MNTKKQKDTNSIIQSQLKIIEERLNDRAYCEIWPQLVKDKEKILKSFNNKI
jgi:hypothetical protein